MFIFEAEGGRTCCTCPGNIREYAIFSAQFHRFQNIVYYVNWIYNKNVLFVIFECSKFREGEGTFATPHPWPQM